MQNVLLVEDNADLVVVLQQLIEVAGYNVRVTPNAETAWNWLEAQVFVPDVILCDLGLPGMGGLAFLRQLRSHETLREMLFIAMSGNMHERAMALQAGANTYLLKPFGIEELEHALAVCTTKA